MPEATRAAGAPLWREAARRIECALGLHFAPGQQADLQRGFAAAAQRLGFASAAECAARVVAAPLDAELQQVLVEALAVGETYFFRDPALFDTLAREILRPLIEARRAGTRHLRMWSAGCASGEEAYSLAMLVAGLLPDWRAWNLSILATDLDRAALARARDATYGTWSMRADLPLQARRFLLPAGEGRWQVDPELARRVHFAPLNLVAADWPAGITAMDLVLCRNVLIYFSPARARAALGRLGQALTDDGWLVTGSVDVPAGDLPALTRTAAGSLTTLRRERTAVVTVPVAPAAADDEDATGQVLQDAVRALHHRSFMEPDHVLDRLRLTAPLRRATEDAE
jgi:chemotaxis protein methyltransferase CheR